MVNAAITSGLLALAGASLASPMPAAQPLARRADMSGCGTQHNSGFHGPNDAHSITSGGVTRSYGIRVPDGYNDNANLPRKVIIDYHGRNGSPSGQYGNSKYDTYDEGKEYLAVYPAGLVGDGGQTAWQGASYASDQANDLQFTQDLLAHLRTQYCIDSDHIYASGKSNGGGFVDTLACSDQGDEFAAFAMSSAALYTDNSEDSCPKKRAIMEAHGDADGTIHYTGGSGAGGQYPDIPTWVSWWGQRDGCSDSDKSVDSESGYELTTYSCNGLTNVVNHFKVEGEGHCWPSTTGDNTDGHSHGDCPNRSLDYTQKVLDFFSQWNLGNAPQ